MADRLAIAVTCSVAGFVASNFLRGLAPFKAKKEVSRGNEEKENEPDFSALLLPELESLMSGEDLFEVEEADERDYDSNLASNPKMDESIELENTPSDETLELWDLRGRVHEQDEELQVLRANKLVLEKVENDLSEARAREAELQKQVWNLSSSSELLLAKQKLAGLRAQEEQLASREAKLREQEEEYERTQQKLQETETELLELRRNFKDLQLQKRKMSVQLSEYQAHLDRINGSDFQEVRTLQAEAVLLRQRVADLVSQLESMQSGRFTEVEEMVYLRWVNACLRYELRNLKAAPGRATALDLNKDLSPRSQDLAKQLMSSYVAPTMLAMHAPELAEPDALSDDDTMSTGSASTLDTDDSLSISEETSSRGSFDRQKMSSKLLRKLRGWGRSRSRHLEDAVDGQGPAVDVGQGAAVDVGHGETVDASQEPSAEPDAIGIDNVIGFDIEEVGGPSDIADYASEVVRGVNEVIEVGASNLVESRGNLVELGGNPVERGGNLVEKGNGSVENKNVLAANHTSAEPQQKLPAIKVSRPEPHTKVSRPEPSQDRSKRPSKSSSLSLRSKKGPDAQRLFPLLGNMLGPGTERRVVNDDQSKGKALPAVPKKAPAVAEFEKREPRVARPPPPPSSGPVPGGPPLSGPKAAGNSSGPPPPPPPPPPLRLAGGPPKPPGPPGPPGAPPPPPPPFKKGGKGKGGSGMHRAPELVSFYQALMKKENGVTTVSSGESTSGKSFSDARNNMIGEIENRSSHLLAVKHDVETQGDFVNSLGKAVRDAAYTDINDVVAFVSWLDEELSFLVDERAVLKHFDWPDAKADAMREAAFEYLDLQRLEQEVRDCGEDDPQVPLDSALKQMQAMLEKAEQNIMALLRNRDTAMVRCRELKLPTQWMTDAGLVGKIKENSVKLARRYMKCVTEELDKLGKQQETEPLREFLLLQGVRFAFRVHQFAGGFDQESMSAFEALRSRANMPGSSSKAEAAPQNEAAGKPNGSGAEASSSVGPTKGSTTHNDEAKDPIAEEAAG